MKSAADSAVHTQGVVLAGGASRRFGHDKAALRHEGMTLLERIAGALAAHSDVVAISGRLSPDDWRGRPAIWIEDREKGAGPLQGLCDAWLWPANLLVCACDLPLMERRALGWLLARVEAQDARCVVPTHDGRPQWSVMWLAAELRAPLAARCAAGARRLGEVAELAGERVRYVEVPEQWRRAFSNVNTEAEMVELLEGRYQ